MAIHAGKATKLQLNSTNIAQVVSIGGPSIEVGTVETTDLDSTWRTFIATINDGGVIDATINYDPTNDPHAQLTGLLTTPTTKAWKIFFPTTTLFFGFGGILTNFNRQPATVDGLQVADISIKVTGAVTMPTTV